MIFNPARVQGRLSLATLVVVVSALTPATADAFRGRIVDPAGNPVAGAEVSVLGRTGTATTAGDGSFRWEPDPPAPFEIMVVLRNGTYTEPVLIEALPDSDAGPLEVTVAPALAEALVVSGSVAGVDATPAAGTTTLTGREISVRQPTNLVETLENAAGVSRVSEGQAAVPAIRGLAGGRTLILIDGARVTAERRVGPSATFLDPTILESVEVARGPGSVAYGSDAFGGVISLRTRNVDPGTPLTGRANATLGTAGRPEQRLSLELSKGFEHGGLLITAHGRDADDWESPEGDVLNSGYSDRGFLLRVERDTGREGRGRLFATWQSDFGRDIERPRNNSATTRFFYPVEDSHRLTAGWHTTDLGGLSRLSINTFLGSYDQTTDQDTFATETSGRELERSVVDAKDFQLRVTGERLYERSRLEFGVDVNGRFDLAATELRATFDLDGGPLSFIESEAIGDARRADTGLFAQMETELATHWTLAGGLRVDRITTDNSGGFFGDRSTSEEDLSGFVALTAGSFRGFTATVQAARGFRDPRLSDRYYRGPTGRGFITGNPDLESETSEQFDLALRYAGRRVRVAVFAYQYDIRDLIERFETEQEDFFLFRNRGEARLDGFEFEAQATLPGDLTLQFAAQIANGTSRDDGAKLDGIPARNLSLQVRRPLGPRAFAQLRTALFDRDDDPGPTERVAPGYTLVDLSGGYRFTDTFELRLLARNLLDDEYLASESRRAILAPGRSLALIARIGLRRE